jgi:uncharacterized protein
MQKVQRQFNDFAAGLFKPGWQGFLQFNSKLGLILILFFGIPRFFIVLQSNVSGDYRWVSLIFVAMCLVPYILLTKSGRSHIGFKSTISKLWLVYSLILGAAFCVILFFLGKWLFHDDLQNWFVYIARSYPIESGATVDRLYYFLIAALMSATFSPMGEEILYRGLIHNCFAIRFGENTASRIDSVAFAVTHLAHFGIIYHAGSWQIVWLPAFLWVLCMFIASRIFFICKVKTDSLLGAILAHAGFNIMMTYLIIYWI